MTRSYAHVRLLCPLLLSAAAFAQSPDTNQLRVELRAELEDGTPMPGVPVVRQHDGARARVDHNDGWLRCVDRELVAAAAPIVGRTDPEGRLTVLAPGGKLDFAGIAAGAPFRSVSLVQQAEWWVLRVRRVEQFVVKATSADGKALADFPLALQRGDRIESFAVTDASGVATFGVEPATSVRLVVVPYGWVGPTDWFPTVAKQLPDKQLEFVVPPFGYVRVRATIAGAPKPVAIEGARLHEPDAPYWSPEPTAARELHGVEFGPVAVGRSVRGSVRFASGNAAFSSPAVGRHGEIVVVDVDADPPRPGFALKIVAPGIEKQQSAGGKTVGIRVAVAIHTDAGAFRTNVGTDDDGRVLVAFDREVMLGKRVLRVDVDAEEHVIVSRPDGLQQTRRWWSGSRACEHELENVVMDLGSVDVVRHDGLLRGRVVDDRGAPVERAQVDVTDAARTGVTLLAWTDEHGRFELSGPLLRDPAGAPAQVIATASSGQGADIVHGEPCAPASAGGDVTLVLPPRLRGFVELTLRVPLALPAHALQFVFVDRGGQMREMSGRLAWSGDRNEVCRIGPLPTGRGALRILLRPGVLLRTVADLEVTNSICRDPRLRDVDLSDVVTTCRMRVVDEEGVPIAGARVEYRGASDAWSIGPSDGGGMLDVLKGPPDALRIVVSAPGKQPVEVAHVVDGADVRLREMPSLCITVKGLPDDLPRDGLVVFLRSVVRENLRDFAQIPLGAQDVASGPLPPPGRYHVRLTKEVPAGSGKSWTTIGQRTDDVLITADAQTFEFVVDDATIQRLRELTKE